MALAAVIGQIVHYFPPTTLEAQDILPQLAEWWETLTPLVTFVTTFFLREAFNHWKVSVSVFLDV